MRVPYALNQRFKIMSYLNELKYQIINILACGPFPPPTIICEYIITIYQNYQSLIINVLQIKIVTSEHCYIAKAYGPAIKIIRLFVILI